jgi:hypothetical protein
MTPDTAELRGQFARQDKVDWLGRVGLAARGVLYALLALLALELAIDRRPSHRPDSEGALRLLSDQPLGEVLLVGLGLGFAAQAAWRLSQAFSDRERAGTSAAGLAERAGYLGIGLLYAGLALVAASLAFGDESGGPLAKGGNERQTAQGVLGWPLGRELVFVVGLGFVAAAVGTTGYVLVGKLDDRLRDGSMSHGSRTIALAAGVGGYLARAIVFAMIGVFLCKAAWEHDPQETRGLDGALLELVQAPFGPLALSIVAAGLLAFAVWSFFEARYRAV